LLQRHTTVLLRLGTAGSLPGAGTAPPPPPPPGGLAATSELFWASVVDWAELM